MKEDDDYAVKMGASWSQGEVSLSKETSESVSQSCDTNTRGNETATEVKLPHNYEAIVKDADSPIDKSSMNKLYEKLHAGVFLNQKRKKYWVERKTNNNCFMVFARDLLITWAEDNRYWHWFGLKDTRSDEFIDVAELYNVCWLEVHGKFEIAKLSPGIMYEVVFVVMLKDQASGWEVPINLRLSLPDGNIQEHKESLMEKPRGQWMEILAGEFKTLPEKAGEMEFSLFEYEGGKWKRGLVIKGVVIRAKN
ncbi:hypothetical protein L1049_009636 [Liquidambar formosana]|uniref:Protein PHLOEM PROTEIN 2-LIKE A1-like n=1 Tax=Liquidambar formosana TaxID=63359 RepID=A0AAP0N8D3_LIQFO